MTKIIDMQERRKKAMRWIADTVRTTGYASPKQMQIALGLSRQMASDMFREFRMQYVGFLVYNPFLRLYEIKDPTAYVTEVKHYE